MSDRKSSNDYWEGEWEKFDPSEEISLNEKIPKNLLNILIHKSLKNAFLKNDIKATATFFEVGCGGSRWLPYFAKEFGFKVNGIDYTDNGVVGAINACKHNSVDARIVKGDYEQMSATLGGECFDVVASFGFVEHFENTKQCISHIMKISKKNGLIITIIPNMTGLYGLGYKLLKPSVYAIHNPLDLKQLAKAHVENGLQLIEEQYLLSTPGIIGATKDGDKGLFKLVKNSIRYLSQFFWLLELKGLRLPRTKILSPYIMCIYKNNA